MEVYMIRHTSVDVPKGTCYGWTDVPVAATFEQEAAVTKKNLEEMLEGKTLDKVFSSTLSRASKLAAYCGYQHPKLDSRLKEAESLSFHPNDCRGTVVISQDAFQQFLACVGNKVEYITTC